MQLRVNEISNEAGISPRAGGPVVLVADEFRIDLGFVITSDLRLTLVTGYGLTVLNDWVGFTSQRSGEATTRLEDCPFGLLGGIVRCCCCCPQPLSIP